ncbi:MAG: carboxypeptidase-like regulatory domain-containing protein [Acidobacteria bacterium]|nr:carboxypeptidase-like regulatory domain-containing protein [Acidobacteriota bacterium]
MKAMATLHRISFVRVILAVFAFCALGTCSLEAQTSMAQITGRTTDASQAVIPGTQITVTNTQTRIQRKTVSNAEGYYTVPLLDPGNYQVDVEAQGFRAISRSGITLQVNQNARIDFELEVGTVTEKIQVTEAAPLVERESSALGTVISNEKIVNLPLNGRNVYSLALLSAGVTTAGSMLENQLVNHAQAGTIIINGGRTRTSEFMIDGHTNTAPFSEAENAVIAMPSPDAVQEFKVQTNGYAAEFGRSSGGVLNATIKSGTNQFHGTAYEFLRNSKLDANNFFSNRSGIPLASFKRNQFGAGIGGPILKDKAFFFFNYEGLRQRSAARITSTPSAQTGCSTTRLTRRKTSR